MIAGPRYVNRGTTVTFNCVADTPGPGEPASTATTVEWRYNDQLVSAQVGWVERGGKQRGSLEICVALNLIM